MVKEWITNLSGVEITLLLFLMAIVFYGLNKMEKDKEEKEKQNSEK
ncbi:hypothetical protein [Campylobacter helveticus]|nr:hypothetical protein [Campylobacter helveticus]MCR2063200.1 hypothetical protein [Campylobacter helveticus]